MVASSHWRIVLLPGSTNDPRLYDQLRRLRPQIETPAFPAPRHGETLPCYARRAARRLGLTPPIVVGGTSFGGLVALEMTHYVPCAACLLIGSAVRPDEFPAGLHPVWRLARGAGPWGPPLLGLAQRIVARLPAAWVGTRLRNACRNALQADEVFRRWAWSAALRWRGTAAAAPVFRIHGARDTTLMPPPPGAHVTILPDAGHLLVATHAPQVAHWLATVLTKLASMTDGRVAAFPRPLRESAAGRS